MIQVQFFEREQIAYVYFGDGDVKIFPKIENLKGLCAELGIPYRKNEWSPMAGGWQVKLVAAPMRKKKP